MIYTELKNTSDKVVVAKWNGVDVVFNPGETKDMAKMFSPEAVHTVISRFQIKNGLVLVTAEAKKPVIPPVDPPQDPEEGKKGKGSKDKKG